MSPWVRFVIFGTERKRCVRVIQPIFVPARAKGEIRRAYVMGNIRERSCAIAVTRSKTSLANTNPSPEAQRNLAT